MFKKHIFLSVFSKIAIFACVFCVFSACADTTTCDINYTPVTGNSIQNGTPTPTNPVEIESVGTKVGNKYQISVTAQGKNLFDASTATLGYINDSGEETTSTASYRSVFIPCKPNTSYVVRGTLLEGGYYLRIHQYSEDNNSSWISMLAKSNGGIGVNTVTGTTSSNAKYIRISGGLKGRVSGNDFQLEEGSTATPYAQYSAPITTPIYLNAPLRKVGDYADVLDYKNGTITRNVGVKVLDGTENWLKGSSAVANNSYYIPLRDSVDYHNPMVCSHLLSTTDYPEPTERQGKAFIGHQTTYPLCCLGLTDKFADTTALQTWLASQYANGTPVTVYYPLATPVVEQIENWSCPVPITDIQIATTKMVDEEFAQAEANLAATVQTIESVVSRTIAQTGQIATLQAEKQTRPDESCSAGKKCLLVEDEQGVPHWYEILEPKFVADGYTQLEYIESTGTQYIDTGIYGTEKHGLEIKYSYPRLNSSYSGRLCGVRTGAGAADAYAYTGTSSGTLSNSETYYVSSNNGTAWSSSKALDTSIHIASVNILNDNKSYFDGQQIITGLTTPYTHTVTTNIFRAYNGSSYAVPTVARVYYCRLTNNGDDVRNFVPAKRNSDNEIGMYDTVSGTFFTNAGTGDFIAGPVAF